MVTDPRIAALAEAIDNYVLPPMDKCLSYADTKREVAAAILAALPPGWCGHIGVEEAIAQGQRMLIASEMSADAEITRLRDKIARLRRIEEAARALIASAEPDDDFDGQYIDWLVPDKERNALRAALEEKP